MKVLEVIATLGVGGAEALVGDLSTELARRGTDVKLFLLAGVRGERGRLIQQQTESQGVQVVGTNNRKAASARNLARLGGIMRRWRPDIVHCHLYSSEVAVATARLLPWVPMPIMVRTLHSTEMVGTRSEYVRRALHGKFDYTVACSRAVEAAYRRFWGAGDLSSLTTIHNGREFSPIKTNNALKDRQRRDLNLPARAFIVAHIGGFRGTDLESGQKGQDILLRGFAAATRDDVNAMLVIAGDGPLRPDAEKLSRSLGVQDRVRFLGDVANPWNVLHAADMFAFPSRQEGLPLALLEAAAAGLPIVATDIPEIRAIGRNLNWRLFAVDDADGLAAGLKHVRANMASLLHVARSEAEVVRQENSIERCASGYLDLFAEAIAMARPTY